MENTYPRLSLLTYLGFEVNSLPERCNTDLITFDYVYQGIDTKTLIQNIQKDFGDNIDFSIILSNYDDLAKLYNVLANASEALRGRERRKVGVEKCGVKLLVAFVLQAIQSKNWI